MLQKLKLPYNRKSYKAKLVGTDSKMDIALLKIDTDEKLPYSTFADSDLVKVMFKILWNFIRI